jgi:hypothetical protein
LIVSHSGDDPGNAGSMGPDRGELDQVGVRFQIQPRRSWKDRYAGWVEVGVALVKGEVEDA